MSKHLSLSERAMIERAIIHGESFTEIGRKLNRSASTISREVKNHRVFAERESACSGNDCVSYRGCIRVKLCPEGKVSYCNNRCKMCDEYDCHRLCGAYESRHCSKLEKPPYVCSECAREKTCKRIHAYYTAHRANSTYEKERSETRKGIRTTPERLLEINDIISPLIRKGQSLNHILVTHKEEIGLSEKTLYNYIDANVFKVKNIDLPKKVAYRPRRKSVLTKMDYKYRHSRTYEDFTAYLEEHPNTSVVEMDTVKGARYSGKVLLTMIFRNSGFMLIFLMKDGTQLSVLEVFDALTEGLGLDVFRKLFPVILTDNGVEFKDPAKLEYSKSNASRTKLFFCDPQASWQKPHVEKNHVELRKILPKGTSFRKLTDSDVNLVCCHINSSARETFGNKTPFEMFSGKSEEKLLELLSLFPVAADEVTLKPKLLNLKTRLP